MVMTSRSLSVSQVQWSVSQKEGLPTSLLESFMWSSETQVDRERERVPLGNVLSQCKAHMLKEPDVPSVRAALKSRSAEGRVLCVPQLQKSDAKGSIRPRYDIKSLASEFSCAVALAVNVSPDWGGSLEDVSLLPSPDTPVLATSLILYPYQIYKARLSGCSAVTLLAAALQEKDLGYLTRIARQIGLEAYVVVNRYVTSLLQIPKPFLTKPQILPPNRLATLVSAPGSSRKLAGLRSMASSSTTGTGRTMPSRATGEEPWGCSGAKSSGSSLRDRRRTQL